MSSGKVLLGLLAGVAAGALIGILFAPDKGWNTRKKITKKADDYVDSMQDKFNEFLETASKIKENMKDEVEDFADRTSAAVKEDLKEKKVSATG
jgi:gas vesicle protein